MRSHCTCLGGGEMPPRPESCRHSLLCGVSRRLDARAEAAREPPQQEAEADLRPPVHDRPPGGRACSEVHRFGTDEGEVFPQDDDPFVWLPLDHRIPAGMQPIMRMPPQMIRLRIHWRRLGAQTLPHLILDLWLLNCVTIAKTVPKPSSPGVAFSLFTMAGSHSGMRAKFAMKFHASAGVASTSQS